MAASRADPRSVRQWNERLVLETLPEHGPTTAAELSTLTGLTPASIRQVISGLVAKGWVDEHTPVVAGRGRPARGYTRRQPSACVLGLDIGAHTVRGVRTGLDGTCHAQLEVSLPDHCTDAVRRDAVHEVTGELQSGIDPSSVWMAGVAVTGTVSQDGHLGRTVALGSWQGRDLNLELSGAHLPETVWINDIRAAAWAHVEADIPDQTDFLYLSLGRRPALSLFLAGQPLTGTHDTAGDVSRCELLPAADAATWVPAHDRHTDPFHDSIDAIQAGDEATSAHLLDYLERIGPAVALAAGLADTPVLVIGGALAAVGDVLRAPLDRALCERLQFPPRIVVGSLDQYAPAIGAARLAREELRGRLVNDHGVAELSRSSVQRH